MLKDFACKVGNRHSINFRALQFLEEAIHGERSDLSFTGIC
jgi:hypothetical protein